MPVVVETTLPNGKIIRVESSQGPSAVSSGLRDASVTGAVVEKVDHAFSEGLALIDGVTEAVYAKVTELAKTVKPKEVSVAFGVKIGAAAGVVLAKGSAEANLQVTVKWEP